MINYVCFRNYKAYEDTGRIDLAPITIIMGANNSGKSVFLQPFLVMKQTFKSLGTYPLLLRGGIVDAGEYEDVVYMHHMDRQVSLEFGFTVLEQFNGLPVSNANFTYKISVRYDEKDKNIKIVKEEICDESGELSIRLSGDKELTIKSGGFSSEIRIEDLREQPKSLLELLLLLGRSDFRSRLKKLNIKSKIIEDLRAILEMVSHNFQSIFYIGPLRRPPTRYYDISERPRDESIGVYGEYTPQILERELDSLRNILTQWLESIDVKAEVKIKSVTHNLISILLKDPESGLEVNLADSGFGISQIIPIVIEGYRSPRKSLVIYEQPELHLHPKAQASLIDFFAYLIREHGKQVIIETHSEHIILRLQRRVAEQMLKPSDVSIYYCEREKTGSKLKRVEVGSDGTIREWPKGFLDTDIEEAYEYAKALLRRPQ
jgi:predicted ATPase